MLRAIFFDFNGVLVDDEPLHFTLFQKTLTEKQISLTRKDYYEKYLGFDDHDAFKAVLKDHEITPELPLIEKLIQHKAALYQQEARKKDLFVPGAMKLIQEATDKYFLGIVSGALRSEIELHLKRTGAEDYFQVIIAAEDVERGKPDPEGYLRALNLLNRDFVPSSEVVLPRECLVIEDSVWGIDAAHAAGMKCLALASSYTSQELATADWVVEDYKNTSLLELSKSFV